MRRTRRPLAVLLAFGTAFTLTPAAGAQEAVTPKLSSACMGFCPGGPPPSHTPFLDKAEYAPGETIGIDLLGYDCGATQATSAGFTATAQLTRGSTGNGKGVHLIGTAKAIATPGTYQATIQCTLSPPVINQFAIKAAPPPAPGPKPQPKPKPPIVKPKGAADTGGGGTS